MRGSSSLSVERGLRVPLHVRFHGVAAAALGLALLLVACGGPEGSGSANDSAPDATASSGGEVTGGLSVPSRSADLTEVGGVELTVVDFDVAEALAAEGGDAVGAMLDELGIEPSEVELSLAVAPGGDPTISDWHVPGTSAERLLEAWEASAPGTWDPEDLSGTPALAGSGVDGSSAWVVASDDRLVYVRTDDRAVAEEVAEKLGD